MDKARAAIAARVAELPEVAHVYTDADTAWQGWVGEVYQLAGAVLLAGDHYTPESLGSLQELLLDALAEPMDYPESELHAEWKRRAVLAADGGTLAGPPDAEPKP